MNTSNIHSQSNSRLLSALLEVRQAIYSHLDRHVHAFLSEGKLRMLICLEPNLGDHEHAGTERLVPGDHARSTDPQWARRLGSSWGPHWECEEHGTSQKQKKDSDHIYNLRLLCKKMFLDVCDIVSEVSSINITDLHTLESLVSQPHGAQNPELFPLTVCKHVGQRIHNLNITLRLPLAFYKDLEDNQTGTAASSSTSISSMTIKHICNTWTRFWSITAGLEQLHCLHVWLDHEDPSSWSVVKERLALGYLFADLGSQMRARSSRKSFPQLHIIFNLPKLHPGIAKEETHFLGNTSPPTPVTIERRCRQRFHCLKHEGGVLEIKYMPDFPIMHELADFWADDSNGELAITFEECEDMEKQMWLRGEDVEQAMLEMIPDFNVCY
ncbi:hypothetical protein ONS95_001513 [Cadophora gregata]|uniref:uncharacterized protein n=1 Tax=Cadophora gregata TaxID=51156 RepID=UPI0026DBA346|nr:uncharacterized protein ONS95_001513 [Cadophora gregata]KAK0111137.1 hypothetical protein ONS95_001513 [Cadophora gregata]